MEDLLLWFGKFRWYVRYPAAAGMVWLTWSMYSQGAIAIPTIIAASAVAITLELSPSLLVIGLSLWLWPTDFLSIPLAQVTFGMIFCALGSAILLVAAPALGFFLHVARGNAKYKAEKPA